MDPYIPPTFDSTHANIARPLTVASITPNITGLTLTAMTSPTHGPSSLLDTNPSGPEHLLPAASTPDPSNNLSDTNINQQPLPNATMGQPIRGLLGNQSDSSDSSTDINTNTDSSVDPNSPTKAPSGPKPMSPKPMSPNPTSPKSPKPSSMSKKRLYDDCDLGPTPDWPAPPIKTRKGINGKKKPAISAPKLQQAPKPFSRKPTPTPKPVTRKPTPAPEAPASKPAPEVPASDPTPEAPASKPAPEVLASILAPEVPASKLTPEVPASKPAPPPRAPVPKLDVVPPRRSGRTTKPPASFNAEPEKKRHTAAKKPVGGKVFDPVYITTNRRSRLVKTDLFHLLLEPAAWDSLSIDDQAKLINLLPPNATNMGLLAKLTTENTKVARPKEFTINFSVFRTDVARFKDDLSYGHLSKTWIANAEQAMVDRAAGKFDKWKAEESERWWGEKSK